MHPEATAEWWAEVAVVGAGPSGIGAAARLLAAGVGDVVVLEQADRLGGTWRDNTYPGCACDVPSALYSYSFAPNPDWRRAFARQAEILAYLERTAADHGVAAVVRLGVRVTAACWDEAERCWRLDTSRGTGRARFLVLATGPWHRPALPDLPGLAGFPGPVFHSARWRHDVALEGRRVAVVGTGASAVQFVPELQRAVAGLHVFQRTASWVLPKPDHRVPAAERWALARLPGAVRLLRAGEYALMELLGIGFRHPRLLGVLRRVGLAHLRRSVPDPELRRALTPDFTPGCKRLLLSNTYLRALAAPNVRLHPTAVAGVEGREVVGADGSRAEVDVIVLGTGFQVLDPPMLDLVRGASGRTLREQCGGRPEAYLGTTHADLPNAFMLLGPNLGTGHSSAFGVLEAQLSYVVDAVRKARRHDWSVLRVRPAVQARYNAGLHRALAGTVYDAGGCTSYYRDESGHNGFAWPWSSGRLRRRLRRFRAGDYVIMATGRNSRDPG